MTMMVLFLYLFQDPHQQAMLNIFVIFFLFCCYVMYTYVATLFMFNSYHAYFLLIFNSISHAFFHFFSRFLFFHIYLSFTSFFHVLPFPFDILFQFIFSIFRCYFYTHTQTHIHIHIHTVNKMP